MEEVKHANTVHGGSLFAAGRNGLVGLRTKLSEEQSSASLVQPGSSTSSADSVDSSLKALLRELHDVSSWDAVVKATSWTVHDGNFFASAVRDHLPRELGERRLVESPQIRLALDEDRVTWQKPKRRGSDPSTLSGSVPASAAQSVRIIAPAPVSTLGKDAAELKTFTLEKTIGMGQFASVQLYVWTLRVHCVRAACALHEPLHACCMRTTCTFHSEVHRARRNRDGLHVALKLWHRPVALTRPGSEPEASVAKPPPIRADGPPCDSEDVACFEQDCLPPRPPPRPPSRTPPRTPPWPTANLLAQLQAQPQAQLQA